jgi:hypothetical protein
MIDYRLYCLDRRGKIATAEWLAASGDEQAVAEAQALGRPTVCELWDRDRFVAKVEPASAA